MALSILLVDDEPTLRLALKDALRAAGHEVQAASDGAEAMTHLDNTVFDVVICDLLLPRVHGMRIFRRVRSETPDTDVVLMTAHGSVKDAVKALKEGATDYLTKPFQIELLLHELDRIGEHRKLANRLADVERRLASRGDGGTSFIGGSPAMARLFERIELIAASDAPVLIRGESGTGKELVARTLHQRSPRRDMPFVALNCAAFPDTLIEAELFGHERGAFTGAVKKRDGRFVTSHGGTLFLDEVAELSAPVQAKLLRVLQDGVIQPLGSDRSVQVDVRVLSATHRDLKARISSGHFREDLFYRLKVLYLAIPPLRERPGDLALLVEHFLRKFAMGGEPAKLSPSAWAVLAEYVFPGNVRELEHAIHHASVLARGGRSFPGTYPKRWSPTGGRRAPRRSTASRSWQTPWRTSSVATWSGRWG